MKEGGTTFVKIIGHFSIGLTCKVLQFDSSSPFARFEQIFLQNGTDYRDVSSSDWSMFMAPLKN